MPYGALVRGRRILIGYWLDAKMSTNILLCRDCGWTGANQTRATPRCQNCHGPRLLQHPELTSLSLAHLDCDAFYAAVEKRDNPELRDQPLIVGGGRRGVVATCCYLARIQGVHSAMPMYRALKLCPNAVVVRPDMEKYRRISHRLRALMDELSPLVEAISIDEAFLDLSGTERLHRQPPAETLAALARRVERDIGITVSIGLSYNKFLAKVASDLDKPRGFSVIGRAEALSFLADKPVGMIWGVGKALARKLARNGISRIGQLQSQDEADLLARYGSIGARLYCFSRGQDARTVTPGGAAKSISSERTFDRDISAYKTLERQLWPMCEAVSHNLKSKALAGGTVTLKLKTGHHRSLTRSRKLSGPTQLARIIFDTGCELLKPEANGTPYRLLGIGVSGLGSAALADQPDLMDVDRSRLVAQEQAIDALRDRFGKDAIKSGRAFD